MEVARRSATGEALACLEDLWDLPLPESGGNCIKSEHDQRSQEHSAVTPQNKR